MKIAVKYLSSISFILAAKLVMHSSVLRLMQLLVIMQPVTDDEIVALLTARRRTGLMHRGSRSAEPSEAEGE